MINFNVNLAYVAVEAYHAESQKFSLFCAVRNCLYIRQQI